MRLVTGVGSDGVIGFRHAGQNTTGVVPACLSIDAPPETRCLPHQPGPEKADDQIRSGPTPHFPDPFYRQDKSRGQVTFLTEIGCASEPSRASVSTRTKNASVFEITAPRSFQRARVIGVSAASRT
jgi:hypothetical protein